MAEESFLGFPEHRKSLAPLPPLSFSQRTFAVVSRARSMKTEISRLQGKNVLVAHPWMGSGGSEATTLWTIQMLQENGANVTLFTGSAVDLPRLNRTYGTTIDPSRLRVKRSPRLPGFRHGSQCAHWQNSWFQRQCHRIAPDFDLLISGYNPIDFGRPGVQLIGDYTWDENLRRALDPDADRQKRHRRNWLRHAYLAMGNRLRGSSTRPLALRGDLVLANSEWIRDILGQQCGLADCPVVYPPVAFFPLHQRRSIVTRDPLAFVCLGRISPEKRIESALRILSRVRKAGFPVTLTIAGAPDQPGYGREIEAMAASLGDWVQLSGFLEAEARDRLLRTASFGIHARPAEAFGIAVAEMAGSGCLPFVPELGGPAEIVTDPALRFRSEDDAVERITALLSRPGEQAELREQLAISAARFLPRHFMESLEAELERFLTRAEDPESSSSPIPGAEAIPALAG